jgi:hypothetical protein
MIKTVMMMMMMMVMMMVVVVVDIRGIMQTVAPAAASGMLLAVVPKIDTAPTSVRAVGVSVPCPPAVIATATATATATVVAMVVAATWCPR